MSGFHEIFHACTVTACQYIAISLIVYRVARQAAVT
jgi:hypothetical protein